jgi:ATP-dependent protease ClpP protease subunit
MLKRPRRKLTEDEKDVDDDNGSIVCIGRNVYFHTDVSTKTVLELIQKLKEACDNASKNHTIGEQQKIYLYIHSDGGDAYAGLSAMNHIRLCSYKVVTICDGLCASAATLMFLGGHVRWMMLHSQFLIHQMSTGFFGKFCDLKDEYKNSSNLMSTFEKIYLKETKITKTKLKELLNGEVCLLADECIAFGIATKMV